jgi:rhamnulokinase/L-fuculokinase
MTADATGLRVTAGPVEAAALGNAVVQFMAHSEMKDLWEARRIIADTMVTGAYAPLDPEAWDEPYRRFMETTGGDEK